MMKTTCGCICLLLAVVPHVAYAQRSTVYASVVSTKPFVVGAPNPQTGLFYQRPENDTTWQHTGRNNIRAFGLDVLPSAKGQILCIASGNGVHQSYDGGKTWKISTGWRITEVLSVTIDSRKHEVLYCTTPYGVFKSTDGGTSWHEKNKGFVALFSPVLLIDPRDSNTLFCATEDGVYRSTDAGESWQRTGLSVGGVRTLAQHPTDSKILFAGTEDHGIYATWNGGKYWEKMEAGIDHSTFYAITFDPTNPQTMYAAGYVTGVYKSTDGGKSWRRMNDGLTNLNVHSIAVDPTNGQRIYAATMFGGVFRSDNGGASWRYAGLHGSQVWTIKVLPF
jgi:photosystem II stability/assembly factor-like uncharacterized protein